MRRVKMPSSVRRWGNVVVIFALVGANFCAAQGDRIGNPAAPPAQSSEVAKLARDALEALHRGDHETAIRDYEKLVKLSPAADHYLNLGIAYFSSERPGEAAQAFERALKLKPTLVRARDYLGA